MGIIGTVNFAGGRPKGCKADSPQNFFLPTGNFPKPQLRAVPLKTLVPALTASGFFEPVRESCLACDGDGYVDVPDRATPIRCISCGGTGLA